MIDPLDPIRDAYRRGREEIAAEITLLKMRLFIALQFVPADVEVGEVREAVKAHAAERAELEALRAENERLRQLHDGLNATLRRAWDADTAGRLSEICDAEKRAKAAEAERDALKAKLVEAENVIRKFVDRHGDYIMELPGAFGVGDLDRAGAFLASLKEQDDE